MAVKPDRLLDGAMLGATHVSLAACVSGLGRPGYGGDMLGLEFALRMRGVRSIVAAHWDVSHATAARFFEVFYREWLGNSLSRGDAWRRAVLALARDAATEREAAAWAGAFSLYGEWT